MSVALAAIPLATIAVAVVFIGPFGYQVLSRGYAGAATALTSGILRALAELASTVCVGALAYAAFLRPRRDKKRFTVSSSTDLAIVRWSSLVWAVTAVLSIGVDAADNGGVSMSRLLTPGALAYLVEGSYEPGAWMLVAAIAFTIFCMSMYVRSWQTTAFLVAVALVAVLAPVVVSQVLVGPNHDWASDAAILGTPATAIWTGLTIVIAVRWLAKGHGPSTIALARYTRIGAVCAVIAVASQVVIASVQLSGWSHITSVTAGLYFAKFVLFAALGVIALTLRSKMRAGAETSSALETAMARRVTAAPFVASAFLLTGVLAVTIVMTRVSPPVYFAPTSIAQVFLGYDITATPTFAVLALDWRFSILFTTMAVVGVGAYLAGVVRLRRRGDAWPVGRTVAWILGWAVILITTSSGLGRYSSVSFSGHMLLHMLLNMLGPMLLVLGGVITLALRATTARRRDEPAGPHEWITAMLNWKFTHAIYNPLHVFISFVGSYYLLYLTPIFGEALRYHWAHQVMNLDFIFIGYLFYGLVIGVDKPPRPLPHIGKLGLVLAAMPFHAFFGVIIMSSKTVIAQLFYNYIDAPWMRGTLEHTQYVGGGIAWAAGEVPLVVVVIVLVTQWSRQDAVQAKRTDRHLDSGIDDSFESYNTMLEQLAGRKPVAAGVGAGVGSVAGSGVGSVAGSGSGVGAGVGSEVGSGVGPGAGVGSSSGAGAGSTSPGSSERDAS